MPNNWSFNSDIKSNNNAQFYELELNELRKKMIFEIERLCSIHNIKFDREQIEILVNNELITPLKFRIQNKSSLINELQKYKFGALSELAKILNSEELSAIQMAISTKKILDANLKLGNKSKEMLKKEENNKNIFDDIYKQFHTKIVSLFGGEEKFLQDIFFCLKETKTILDNDFYSKKYNEIMSIFISINSVIKNNLNTIRTLDESQKQNITTKY